MLGRWGVDGIRGSFFGEVNPRGFSSGLRGGVLTRTSLETFLGDGTLLIVSITNLVL
jgi:hypothetical protein